LRIKPGNYNEPPDSSLFSINEEKTLRDEDEWGGLSLFSTMEGGKKKDKVCSLLSSALISYEKQKTSMNIAFIIIFCHNFVRIVEDKNKCNTCNCFLCKGTSEKKNKEKKGLMYIYLPQMH